MSRLLNILRLIYNYSARQYVFSTSIRSIDINKLVDSAKRVTASSNMGPIALFLTLNPSNAYVIIFAFASLSIWAFIFNNAKYHDKNQIAKEVQKQDVKNS